MPNTERQKFLFIINPVSGGKSKVNWEAGIRDYFKTSPHAYEVYGTRGEGDIESIKYWIDCWKPDKVVAVGGDGTVKLVAEALLGSGTPLCIFPAGSANGMARELAMPADLEDCMEVLLNGQEKWTDVIRVNHHNICLHLSDIGINAQLVKYFEERNVRGKLGYARGVLRVLMNKRVLEVRIKRGDTFINRTAFMVVLANASMYGTGAKINPAGDLHDGLFEVVILRQLSIIELLKMLFLNAPFNPKKTELIQATSLTIEVRKKAYFQVDGEYLGKTKRITAQVEKQALLLVFPKEEE